MAALEGKMKRKNPVSFINED